MPEDSSKIRRRLDCIAKTMRQFGLTDPGEIGDALSEPPFPSLASLERTIKSLDLRLPRNVSARLLSEALLTAVNDESPATLKWRENFGDPPKLVAIKSGATQAALYHRTIFKALQGIFDGFLSNGRIEQEINTGIHRVDIMFDNFAEKGFFAEIRNRFQLPCTYVPTECKNYTSDLRSPEYDQLAGRLSDDVGRVGLLVFRTIKDRSKALMHQQTKWKKREMIIMLDDTDIMRMYKARYDGRPNDINGILFEKVREILLNSTK
ncbi:MAG: hypothetical protein LC794_02660 [Acidobacteria bacterium]|nr:hypothetical protein [Acidobacteriota bacterium]